MGSPRPACLHFLFVISKNTSLQAQFKTQIKFSTCNMFFILSVYAAGPYLLYKCYFAFFLYSYNNTEMH
jgi:hypothetical protein